MTEPRHVLAPDDLSGEEIDECLERAIALKASREPPAPSRLRVGALYWNPSLRTRVSFEQAAWLLGGNCQTLNASEDTWKIETDPQAVMDGASVENIVEAARVLGRYFHILGVRAFPGVRPWKEEREEPAISGFAEHAGVPVISLEGAMHHPCQSLADLLTLRENFPEPQGLPVALVWAWHPKALPPAVPHSFALQMAQAGTALSIVHPEGWDLDPEVMAAVRDAAAESGGTVRVEHDRRAGLAGAKVVYVKSWGRLDCWGEPERESQLRAGLRHWIVDESALEPTDDARVMHCLPVRRNVVIAGAVLDSWRSLVTEQAENRLWAQAGLLQMLAEWQDVLAPPW